LGKPEEGIIGETEPQYFQLMEPLGKTLENWLGEMRKPRVTNGFRQWESWENLKIIDNSRPALGSKIPPDQSQQPPAALAAVGGGSSSPQDLAAQQMPTVDLGCRRRHGPRQ